MNAGTRFAASLVGVVLAVTLTACGGHGDLIIDNLSSSDVTVLTGDDEVTVPASGGVALLDYGCTPGEVTVRFDTAPAVVLPGPVCPDQRIVVRDGAASLQPTSASST